VASHTSDSQRRNTRKSSESNGQVIEERALGLPAGPSTHEKAARGPLTHKKVARKPLVQISVVIAYLGISTLSMTWMTPLLATMSVFVTLALSTITPPVVPTVNSLPCTVFTLPAFTSLAITVPGTTW